MASNALDLGSLFVELKLKTEGFNTALSQAERTFQQRMGAVQQLAGRMALGLSAAFAGAFMGIRKAVGGAADFEAAMNLVEVNSGAAAGQVAELAALAERLGQETVFSSLEAANALNELVKGGVSVQEIMSGAAEATVFLAAAGGIDLRRAAEIAANAMNAFNLSGGEMMRVADALAGVALSTTADMSDLAFGFASGAALAKQAGQTLEEFTAAMGAMAEAAILGSDAGTALRSFLAHVVPTTKGTIQAFQDLGLITEATGNKLVGAGGQIKDFTEMAAILDETLQGFTEEERINLLSKAFGSDAIRAATALAAAGRAGFERLKAAMRPGTAEEVAQKRMEGLAGAIEELSGSMETLLTRIGQPLLEPLEKLTRSMTELVGQVLKLPKPLLDIGTYVMVGGTLALGLGALVGTAAAAGAGLTPLITALGGTAAGAAIGGGLLSALGAVIAAITGPIGLIAALGLLSAALISKSLTEREKAPILWDLRQEIGKVKQEMEFLRTQIELTTEEQRPALENRLEELATKLSGLETAADNAETALDVTKGAFRGFGASVTETTTTVEKVGTVAEATARKIESHLGTGKVAPLLAGLDADVAAMAKTIRDAGHLGGVEAAVIDIAQEIVSNLGTGVTKPVVEKWGLLPSELAETAEKMSQAITDSQMEEALYGPVRRAADAFEFELPTAAVTGVGLILQESGPVTQLIEPLEVIAGLPGKISRDMSDAAAVSAGKVQEISAAVIAATTADLTLASAGKLTLWDQMGAGFEKFNVWMTGPKGTVGILRRGFEEEIPSIFQRLFDDKLPKAFGDFISAWARGIGDAKTRWKSFTDALEDIWGRALSDMVAAFTRGFTSPVQVALKELGTQANNLLRATFKGVDVLGGPGGTRPGGGDKEPPPTIPPGLPGLAPVLVPLAMAGIFAYVLATHEDRPIRLTGRNYTWDRLPSELQEAFRRADTGGQIQRQGVRAASVIQWNTPPQRFSLDLMLSNGTVFELDLTAQLPNPVTVQGQGVQTWGVTAAAVSLIRANLLRAADIGLQPFWEDLASGEQTLVQVDPNTVALRAAGSLPTENQQASTAANQGQGQTQTPVDTSGARRQTILQALGQAATQAVTGLNVMIAEAGRDVQGLGMIPADVQGGFNRSIVDILRMVVGEAGRAGIALSDIPLIPTGGGPTTPLTAVLPNLGTGATDYRQNVFNVSIERFFGSESEMRQLTNEIMRLARQEGLILSAAGGLV